MDDSVVVGAAAVAAAAVDWIDMLYAAAVQVVVASAGEVQAVAVSAAVSVAAEFAFDIDR